MLQVGHLVGMLEELLDSPTVSQDLGQKTLNVISNLMDGDSAAVSSSANRFDPHASNTNTCTCKLDLPIMFLLSFLATG